MNTFLTNTNCKLCDAVSAPVSISAQCFSRETEKYL